MFFVYMLQCNDGTYYVGSTNNLERRVHNHNTSKAGAHYTKIRRPVALVYHEQCDTYADARKREGQLKRLTRLQKSALLTP
jgi:putative endonuclease